MKRILLSLATVALVGGIGVTATRAFFSNTETSYGNTFTAGKLDLKVDYNGYYNEAVDGTPNAGQWTLKDLSGEKFFNFTDLKPSDYGEGTISLHVYDNNAWACMTVAPVKNDDMSSTESELSAGDVAEDASNLLDGELAQNLTGTIWADVCAVSPAVPGDNIYQDNGCDKLIGTGIAPLTAVTLPLADKNGNVFTGVPGQPLVGLQDYYIGVSWSLPETTDNKVQTDSYVADISFYTEQERNNSSFVCGQQAIPTPRL